MFSFFFKSAGKGSPLFSEDQGAVSPLLPPPPTGVSGNSRADAGGHRSTGFQSGGGGGEESFSILGGAGGGLSSRGAKEEVRRGPKRVIVVYLVMRVLWNC